MTDTEFCAVEQILGYTFADKSLLLCALTNASYVNEKGGEGNERLEFLGDGILNFLVAEYLYRHRKDNEGVLTQLRAETVSREPLSMAVDDMGLLQYYRLGKGARNTLSSTGEKFKSNIFESVLAAIYLDGGMEAARAFVESKLLTKDYKAEENYKSILQEKLAVTGETVQYRTEAADSAFVCCITVDGQVFEGHGRKKIVAEQDAAKHAVEHLLRKN